MYVINNYDSTCRKDSGEEKKTTEKATSITSLNRPPIVKVIADVWEISSTLAIYST
jgi:hypothetical protein